MVVEIPKTGTFSVRIRAVSDISDDVSIISAVIPSFRRSADSSGHQRIS